MLISRVEPEPHLMVTFQLAVDPELVVVVVSVRVMTMLFPTMGSPARLVDASAGTT